MTGNIFTELTKGFQRMRAVSEMERLSIHRAFAAFYNNDYLFINEILKQKTLNNPYSEETLKLLMFQHMDITKKILKRLSSGIYTNEAIRELIINETLTDENLKPLLKKINYSQKVKEAFRKAIYYNVILMQPVYDYESKKIRLDIITPDNIEVETKEDFNEIKIIKVCKARPDGTLYYSVWTEDEHYIIDGENKVSPPYNPEGVNPFGKIPFSVLRIQEGLDFYGEPNWNIFINQINIDIRLTDMDLSEMKTTNGVFHGINTNFEKDISFSAGKIIQSQEREGERVALEPVIMNIDYDMIREGIEWKMKTVMNIEGLSAQSSSNDVAKESGVKRSIDEAELMEVREDYKETLYNFEIDLLNNIRMVNNFYLNPKLNDKGYFEVTFSEETPMERIDDKIKRRQMEKEIGYKNDVTFTMEDMEISEQEAIEILHKIDEQNKLLDIEDSPQTVGFVPSKNNNDKLNNDNISND